MANVEHKNLTDPELHEPKGIAGASSDQVYVADGSGGGAWTTQSPAYAQGYVTGNSSATTIATVDTPVAVNFGGAFVTDIINNFSVNTAGLFTYTGSKSITARVTATIFASQASAASKEYTFQVAKNSSVLAASLAKVQTDGSVGRALSVTALVELVTNDTIEIFVENNTDTTNVTIEEATVNVSSLQW